MGRVIYQQHRRGPNAVGMGIALFLIVACGSLSARGDSTLDLRLRIAWGGGAASQWSGKISLSEGSFSDLKSLGLETDTPGLLQIVDNVVPIQGPTPRRYQAIDVSIQAPSSASLVVELERRDRTQERKRVTVSIAELVSTPSSTAIDLDDNQLLIRRAPADRMRVDLHREHLVFNVAEPWQIDVTPHELGKTVERLELRAQLHPARSNKVLWKTQRDVPLDESGRPQAVRELAIPTPQQPGVYDLVLSAIQPARRSLRAPTPLASRRVQFVVVPEPNSQASGKARTLFEINPSEARWWSSLRSLSPLTGALRRFRMEEGEMSPIRVGNRAMGELPPTKSQVFSLPIETPGALHRLTIEYPQNHPQQVRLTLADRGSDDGYTAITDTVLLSTANAPGQDTAADAMSTYEIAFWPNSNTVKLVLTNQDADAAARIGSLKLVVGQTAAGPNPAHARRAVLAQFGVRLPLQFNASYGVDRESSQQLTDWQTFYETTRRAIEFLKLGGYTGAVVNVMEGGTALYPSQLLDATPQADTGVYFNEGHDPLRKDVVELLFRMFEREGLQLVPRFRFDAPLPSLESLSHDDHRLQPYNRLYATAEDVPAYDVTVETVQEAMRAVVHEFVDRYQDHVAFAGIAIELTPATYTQLPSLDWGYSPLTIANFATAKGLDTAITPQGVNPALLPRLRNGDLAAAWRQYRVDQVARFYASVADCLPRRVDPLPIYLSTAGLTASTPFAAATKPVLVPELEVSQVMADMGLALPQLAGIRGLTLAPPVARCLHGDRGGTTALTAAHETTLDRAFYPSAREAVTIYHDPRQRASFAARAARLQASDPLPRQQLKSNLTPQPRCTANARRRELAETLAKFDSRTVMLDEGALPVDFPAQRTFTEVLAALPDVPFETLAAADSAVVVRTAVHDETRYVYAVNDTPWSVEVDLAVTGEARDFVSLGPPSSSRWTPDNTGGQWRATVEPYGLIAAKMSAAAEVARVDADVPAMLTQELNQQISALITRTKYFKQPLPMAWLRDPGFENQRATDAAAWSGSPEAPHSLTLDDRVAHNGQRSMRLSRTDDKYVWMRSGPLPAPPFGRLTVQAWTRFDPRYPEARLRVCVEGRHQGRPYYRFATFSAADVGEPGDWVPCLLRIDDLPMEELSDLRLRFDLLTPGMVWIDDVSVFDRAFTVSEQQELAKIIALADLQLREGNVRACYQTLSGYWPRYVERVVPAGVVRVARADEEGDAQPQ